ncbi:hypothetical protein [Parachitinimonas caeni]|uniref:Uncharacterized protein n=1 Tax=Parachitinimonas caeni TaxID=3031301 RepID=A0ABT7E3K2_9NEIS|nr:hypothetical protein [Parachitinimonas caeni]MDK2126883.1 hypothetical protein [Parachitinimonas caeni]
MTCIEKAKSLILDIANVSEENNEEGSLFFKEYLVCALSISEKYEISGWPFIDFSKALLADDTDWSELDEFMAPLMKGGIYRQMLAFSCVKWISCHREKRESFPDVDNLYNVLYKFLLLGTSVRKEHKFLDVGDSVFYLDPNLYKVI